MRFSPTNQITVSLVAAILSVACATGMGSPIPPAPIRAFWPDPAFDPAVQCRGAFSTAALQSLLPRAQLALRVPGTEEVALDQTGRCIQITVEDIETGRFAALLMRGLGVPRRAVLLRVAMPAHHT